MKNLLKLAFALLCVTALTVNAADGEKNKKELTDDQKKVMKEMLEKYDTNKDGKLDQDERAKMSDADKQKMKDAGLGGKKKKDS